MIFKYSEEFAQDLAAVVSKPGPRQFVGEALAELERELSARSTRFLRSLQTGRGAMVALERKGKAQIIRGESREGGPRFLIRFFGSPTFVLVATCDVYDEHWSQGEVRTLAFTAIVELADELAKISKPADIRPEGRM